MAETACPECIPMKATALSCFSESLLRIKASRILGYSLHSLGRTERRLLLLVVALVLVLDDEILAMIASQ